MCKQGRRHICSRWFCTAVAPEAVCMPRYTRMPSPNRWEDNNAGEGMGLPPVCHAPPPRFLRNSICVRRVRVVGSYIYNVKSCFSSISWE
jgi:hypothetical protein